MSSLQALKAVILIFKTKTLLFQYFVGKIQNTVVSLFITGRNINHDWLISPTLIVCCVPLNYSGWRHRLNILKCDVERGRFEQFSIILGRFNPPSSPSSFGITVSHRIEVEILLYINGFLFLVLVKILELSTVFRFVGIKTISR